MIWSIGRARRRSPASPPASRSGAGTPPRRSTRRSTTPTSRSWASRARREPALARRGPAWARQPSRAARCRLSTCIGPLSDQAIASQTGAEDDRSGVCMVDVEDDDDDDDMELCRACKCGGGPRWRSRGVYEFIQCAARSRRWRLAIGSALRLGSMPACPNATETFGGGAGGGAVVRHSAV